MCRQGGKLSFLEDMVKKMTEYGLKDMYAGMGIGEEVYEYGRRILGTLEDRFREIDRIAEYNQLKVVRAMQESQVSEACLLGTTGYGYNDLGRDRLEEVYARVFHTEDALVRPQITCGTHALALALPTDRWICFLTAVLTMRASAVRCMSAPGS